MNVVRPASSPNPANSRVTIVEADTALASVLTNSLTAEGYVVENVIRGEEAVERLAAAPPDLAIVEWMLSGMSGPEICTRLRAEDATRTLPIIMLSSRGEEILRLRGFSAGADDFVVKPFSMRELIARVHALLRRNRFAVENRVLIRGDLQLDHELEGSVGACAMSLSTELDSGYSNVWLSDRGPFFLASTSWSAFGGHPSTSPTEQSTST